MTEEERIIHNKKVMMEMEKMHVKEQRGILKQQLLYTSLFLGPPAVIMVTIWQTIKWFSH